MSDIYVHHNPGNVNYNAYLLMFIRSWYMPTREGDPVQNDSWLRVPAIKTSKHNSNNAHYTCVNGNLELVSVMTIVEETGKLSRIARGRPGYVLQRFRVEDILKEAIDISEWEYTRQQSWPYNLMFDKVLIQYRFRQKYGDNRAKYMDPTSDNQTFMQIRKLVLPKPCGCGRAKYVTNK